MTSALETLQFPARRARPGSSGVDAGYLPGRSRLLASDSSRLRRDDGRDVRPTGEMKDVALSSIRFRGGAARQAGCLPHWEAGVMVKAGRGLFVPVASGLI